MVKDCIICGKSVIVEHSSEIITCDSHNCIMVVENNIGLHYQVGAEVEDPNNAIINTHYGI